MIDFNTRVIGFDLETQGSRPEYALQPWRAREGKAWVSAAAWTKADASTGSLFTKTDTIKAVLEPIVEKNLYVCGWNVTFDCAWLIALGLEELAFRIKWLDSMLLWRHLCVEPEGDDIPAAKRKSYALEAAMHEFFPDEAGFKEFKDFHTQDPEQLKLLLHRCKEDTRFAVRLGEMFWQQLSPKQQQAALIEARCIPLVAKANVDGIWSSREHAEKLSERLVADGEAVKETLLSLCSDLVIVESGLKPKELKALQEQNPSAHLINLGSPQQLATLLFDIWGLPCEKQTKGTKTNPEGNRSTDKYVLYELAFQDPRAKMLKEVREAKNNNTKYAVATQKSLDYNGDGYIRPQARIFSTYSSRMTYSSDQKKKGDKDEKTKAERYQIGIALHQMKRGKDFRRLIRPPEGFSLVELDFAGQEFGWMAVASMDETMLLLREPGEDAHSYMGAQIAQMDYRELMRLVKEEDETAVFQRKLGKFCIAEGEMVLTDHGLVAIEKVSLDMRVWDGIEWVNHTGSVYQGVQRVIKYRGLSATPDHICATAEGLNIPLNLIAAQNLSMMSTGSGVTPLRYETSSSLIQPRCALYQRVVPTYDITNAGPRHRYTVSNYLVSNSNLSFQYRVGPKTALMKARTDYEMDLDETFIKQILATYKATYKGVAGGPGVIGYWAKAIYKAKMAGYAETFAGRRVQLKGSWAGRDAWPMESTAINYPIQGTGGDQKYLALAVARNMLPKHNGHFYYELHDGIFFIFPHNKAQKAAEDFRTALSNLPYKQAWGVDLPITFPVDAKISSESWGDLKNI